MFAVVQVGSSQFQVKEKDKVDVDRMTLKEGEVFTSDKVLLLADKEVLIGSPFVKDATVDFKVLKHFKGDKVTVFKMHPKVRYRRTRGYRHSFSTLEVVKIHTTVVKAKPKKSTSESEGKDMVKTEKVAIRKRRVVKKD